MFAVRLLLLGGHVPVQLVPVRLHLDGLLVRPGMLVNYLHLDYVLLLPFGFLYPLLECDLFEDNYDSWLDNCLRSLPFPKIKNIAILKLTTITNLIVLVMNLIIPQLSLNYHNYCLI